MQKVISKLNIIFLGSPEIGATVLRDLLDLGMNISAVITRPDRPCGRGCKIEETPVKTVARKAEIPVFQPSNKEELTTTVKDLRPDLAIVAAYGMMIPNEALEAPKHGMINFHPSLLPELRGPSPISMAIMCGHKKTGVSIIQISEKMDAGDILAQNEVLLTGEETTPSLSQDLAQLGAEMLGEVVRQIEDNKLNPQSQDDSKATFTPIIKKSDGEIIFQTYHASNIEQAARAFTPWPGVFTTWNGKRLEIIEPTIIKGTFEPGRVIVKEGQIIIGSAKDAIAPKYLKLEGKKRQTAKEFLCGYQEFVGSILN